MQPLDVAVFRPVKATWRTIVHDFRIKHEFKKIKRTDFSMLVKECFDKTLKPQTIQSAFECTGLYPFKVGIRVYVKSFRRN